MDISNWGIGKIMQLPDWCFGRRYLVSCTVICDGVNPAWDISEVSFPEMFVIWEMRTFCSTVSDNITSIRIAMGDQLPVAVAEMNALSPLINGLGAQGPEPRAILPSYYGELAWNKLRQNVAASGRNLVVEATSVGAGTPAVMVGVVVSSVPREVPDWLISGRAAGL